MHLGKQALLHSNLRGDTETAHQSQQELNQNVFRMVFCICLGQHLEIWILELIFRFELNLKATVQLFKKQFSKFAGLTHMTAVHTQSRERLSTGLSSGLHRPGHSFFLLKVRGIGLWSSSCISKTTVIAVRVDEKWDKALAFTKCVKSQLGAEEIKTAGSVLIFWSVFAC